MIHFDSACCQSSFRPIPSLSSAFAAHSRKVSTAVRDHSPPRLSATSRAKVPSAKRAGFQSAGNLNGLSFGSVERARLEEGEAFEEEGSGGLGSTCWTGGVNDIDRSASSTGPAG